MSAVATRERAVGSVERGSAEPPAQRLFEPQGPTLEDSIIAMWRELTNTDRATCPVCSGEMTPASGCSTCGAELG